MSLMRHPEPLAHPGALSHPSHHPSNDRHKLKWKHTTNPFMCNGCKEAGVGNKFKCITEKCHFNLHEKCALPLRTIEHPCCKESEFRFLDKFRHSMECDLCNEVVRGCGYRCRDYDYVLHPRCANLPAVLHGENLELHLRRKSLSQPCKDCKKKGGSGWSYISKCQKVNLHVACAKKLQMEVWDKKVRETRAKIPGKAVTPKNQRDVKEKGGGGGGGKILNYVRSFAVAVRLVVGALLGDPMALIEAVAICILPSQRKKPLAIKN